MLAGLALTTSELLTVAVPGVLGVVTWMTYVTKMLWDIRVDVSTRSARQDTTLDDHERRITELESIYR